MLVVAAVLLVVFAASVRWLRAAGDAPRWPFLLASVISGGAFLVLVVAVVVALITGRDTWNGWVSGSESSETVTLWLLLIVGPVLIATCVVLLTAGAILGARHRRRAGRASS